MDDLLPAGGLIPDLERPHYHYLWSAQYDDIDRGPWVRQFDAEGRERSIGRIDWTRVVRVRLVPRIESNRPTFEMHLDRSRGVRGLKHWQVEKAIGSATEIVREVLTLLAPEGPVYCVYDWEKNLIVFSTSQDF